MFQSQSIVRYISSGVGRLHRGQRTLGCVGYRLQISAGGRSHVEFDPVPDSADGEIFSLKLCDGRMLECQATDHRGHFEVLGDGPHPERRTARRQSLGRLLA